MVAQSYAAGAGYPTRRMALRRTYLKLVVLAAVFGVMCGLVVVYAISLPQMEDLARYRPKYDD